MSEPPDLEALAERYLELWERQAALLAEAPVGPEVFAAWMAALGAAVAGGGKEGSDGNDSADAEGG
jgi:L-amino acid N-acyltransferase YncA